MFKPLTIYIGLRYTRAKRRTQFISFITLTSVLGIALGVTALITVLSVMNGFEDELRQRILGMTENNLIFSCLQITEFTPLHFLAYFRHGRFLIRHNTAQQSPTDSRPAFKAG
jgi:ABC-type lipoprotein release transport system permease subunit